MRYHPVTRAGTASYRLYIFIYMYSMYVCMYTGIYAGSIYTVLYIYILSLIAPQLGVPAHPWLQQSTSTSLCFPSGGTG